MLTDGRTDGNRAPISHPATSRCDKKRICIAKRTISSKKVLSAIFFNSCGPVVQVPCPSGHTVTGRFYKNSVLKKVKEFYNKKRPGKG